MEKIKELTQAESEMIRVFSGDLDRYSAEKNFYNNGDASEGLKPKYLKAQKGLEAKGIIEKRGNFFEMDKQAYRKYEEDLISQKKASTQSGSKKKKAAGSTKLKNWRPFTAEELRLTSLWLGTGKLKEFYKDPEKRIFKKEYKPGIQSLIDRGVLIKHKQEELFGSGYNFDVDLFYDHTDEQIRVHRENWKGFDRLPNAFPDESGYKWKPTAKDFEERDAKKKPAKKKKDDFVITPPEQISRDRNYFSLDDPSLLRIPDSDPTISDGSRLDKYWKSIGMESLYSIVRPNSDLPESLQTFDAGKISESFNLNGIGFGNWVTVEDKMNYIRSLTLALYDLNDILGFGSDIGMGLLSITFGARGKSKALAHFEPSTNYINITRYSDSLLRGNKIERFFSTGGMGALAHEYGHFLDYVYGRAIDGKAKTLTGDDNRGQMIDKSRQWTKDDHKLRILVDDLLEKIYFNTPGDYDDMSPYYLRLKKHIDNSKAGDYWESRKEVFARWFETYIALKLSENKVRNLLLSKSLYSSAFFDEIEVQKGYGISVYPTPEEIKAVAPIFDKIFSLMKKEKSN